jgi:hypothetical protein
MDHHAKAIELRAIDELKPYSGNASGSELARRDRARRSRLRNKTHSEKQIRQIAKSIERFKFLNPVLIDDEGTIIAGHGRVLAR